jgi:hypothetical protein
VFGIHLETKKEVKVVETAVASILIPSSIFIDRELAPLEAITEYLKDTEGMSFHEIASLLNRDDRTIWTCYHRAKKKKVPEVNTDGA